MVDYRQTTVTAPAKGFDGQISESNPYDTASRAVETAAGIAFGRVVSRGTNKDSQVVIGGAVPFGVTCRTHDTESVTGSYAQYDRAKIMRSGYMFCTLATSSTAGAGLHYNTTTGVIDSGVAGGGEAYLPGEVVEGCGAGEVALIHVNVIPEYTELLSEIADIADRLGDLEDAVGIPYDSSVTLQLRVTALES